MLGGSDAGAHLDLMCHANYPTVVLGEVVRDRGLLSLEEAVRMMTDGPPASTGCAIGAGSPRAGIADLVVFDPATVGSDRAVAARPARRRRAALRRGGGIEHVLVGGSEVVATAGRRAPAPASCCDPAATPRP